MHVNSCLPWLACRFWPHARWLHGWRLGGLWCLLLAIAAPAVARSGFDIDGLPGLVVSLAVATDPGTDRSQPVQPPDEAFAPVPDGALGPRYATGMWFRIDLTVPEALRGQSMWLQLAPASAWIVRLHEPDGTVQQAGMSVPVAEHNHPAVLSRFRITLKHPQMRLYLNVGNTLGPLNHLSFVSDEGLLRMVQSATLVQAAFLGASGLMLLLALMNAVATREAVHGAFAIYIACTSLLVLFTNGYVAAFVITHSPVMVARGSLLAGALSVWATMLFSIELLQLAVQAPRLTSALRGVMWVTLAIGALGLDTDLIASLGALLWVEHLVVGLLLLGWSGRLAWRQRSKQHGAIFAGYLSFNVFEKVPILTMAGVLPVQVWTSDVAKLGVLCQLLLTHLHLVLRLRAQRDVEQRALAAGQEAQSERAQRAELSKFLGMFGHEVRTPLAIIDAATQSLEMMPGGDEPAHEQRHRRIRSAVQRLDRLAREALSRERMASGTWQLRPRDVALAALIDDTLTLQGLLTPGDGLADGLTMDFDIGGRAGGQLRLELPPGLGDLLDAPGLHADPDLLQVALGNLLDNARKYGDAGSVVQLQVGLLRPDGQAWSAQDQADTAPTRLRLSVLSQGSALTADELIRVFEKYWRRDEQGNVGGAGIGLHLVRNIAQLHGGRAWAQSLPDRRTAFSIEWPLRAETGLRS
jgi:signal transduction histidine kinase